MSSIINPRDFEQEVLHSTQPVLVYFWAPWCGLCRIARPILEKLSQEKGQQIKLVVINADENLKLANTYRLKNLPTLLLFNNGNLVKKLDNFNSRETLRQTLENLISNVLVNIG